MPLHFKAHSAIKITQGDNGRQVRNGPCSLCYSRAASVFVPAPTQHLVTWPIHGHVSQFSNRAPRLPAWRALRRAAVPLAASRHQHCTRIAHTWLRCCCTAARDVVWLLWCRGAVHRLGSMAHCVSLLPPTLLFFFPSLSFLFCGPLSSIAGNQGLLSQGIPYLARARRLIWRRALLRARTTSMSLHVGASSLPFFSLHGWSL